MVTKDLLEPQVLLDPEERQERLGLMVPLAGLEALEHQDCLDK